MHGMHGSQIADSVLRASAGAFRALRYRPGTTTMAVVSPLPLSEACEAVGAALAASAFSAPPPAALVAPTAAAVPWPSLLWLPRAGESALVSASAADASRPFADFGRVRGGAMALQWARRRALLCLAWVAAAAWKVPSTLSEDGAPSASWTV